MALNYVKLKDAAIHLLLNIPGVESININFESGRIESYTDKHRLKK